jgi:hypothetical protein
VAFCCCWCGGGGRRARCAIRKGSTWSDCRYKSVDRESTPKKSIHPINVSAGRQEIKICIYTHCDLPLWICQLFRRQPRGNRSASSACGAGQSAAMREESKGDTITRPEFALVSIISWRRYRSSFITHRAIHCTRALTAAVCLAGCVAMR